MQRRAEFGRLEDDGVAACKRHGDRARAKNHRRIPWCDTQNNANRLADTHGHQARRVRRNDIALNLGGHATGFAQHIGGKVGVKTTPHSRAAGFIENQLAEFVTLGFHDVGSLEQDLAPRAGTHF